MTECLLREYKVALTIPFYKAQLTEICSAVLRIDKEPSRSFIKKNIEIVGNNLIINFSGGIAKNLRVSVSSFLESLILCCQTMKQFEILTAKYN